MQPRGRRERRLRERRRRAPASGRCSAGLRTGAGSSPRTRSCSRWRPCSTASAPAATFKTRLYAAPRGTRSRATPSDGSLVVVGAGDPALGRAGFARRQRTPARPRWAISPVTSAGPGIKRVTGKVLADDSIFDRRRGIPTTGVDASGELGPLSGLSFDSGIAHGHYAKNPELVAARALRHKLRAARRPRQGRHRSRRPPARALAKPPLGSVSSPPIGSLTRRHAQALEQLLRRDAPEAPGGVPARAPRAPPGAAPAR